MFLLNETCTIKRPVRTAGDMGGFTQTLTTIGSYRCRISGLSAADVAWAGAMQEAASAALYLEVGANIQVEDHVTVRDIEYIALLPVMPSIPAFKKVLLKNVKR